MQRTPKEKTMIASLKEAPNDHVYPNTSNGNGFHKRYAWIEPITI